jgi:hypothetical protein
VIPDIEKLCAELHPESLFNRDVLEHPHILVEKSRASQGIFADIAKAPDGWQAE